MARHKVFRDLGPGNRTLPVCARKFVLVHEDVHRQFWDRWREIEQESGGHGMTVGELLDNPGILGAVRAMREAARAELREWARDVAPQASGNYLIPV